MSVLTRTSLREVVASAIRDHRGDAPGTIADEVMCVLAEFAPKSFVEGRLDLATEEKCAKLAEELIRTKAFDIEKWEINAAYPTLKQEDVDKIDDLIGMASITVSFN